MKFTDVLHNVLDYTASNFPNILTAFSTLGICILTWKLSIHARKAFHANTISNSRPPYIDSLRKSFSNLHGYLLIFQTSSNDDIRQSIRSEIDKAICIVIYHFNEHEQMNIDRKFIQFIKDEIQDKVSKNNLDEKALVNFRNYASAMLQYEWDNFKKEVEKGDKLSHQEKEETKRNTIDKLL